MAEAAVGTTIPQGTSIVLRRATAADREAIYRLRHEVYGHELGQHQPNAEGRLTDPLDALNWYVVAEVEGQLAGFVSITPPSAGLYSVDKYFLRAQAPFPYDAGLFEVRILTVAAGFRRSHLAHLLMLAALREVQAAGGTRIVGMGRADLMATYRDAGLAGTGVTARSGAVAFELMHGAVEDLERRAAAFRASFAGLLEAVQWPAPEGHAAAIHGGRSFETIGSRFEHLGRRHEVVPAEVLDAWFDPAPAVVKAVAEHLAWALSASPPAAAEGLLACIAEARGVPQQSLVAAGGSSALIHAGLRRWAGPRSRVLLLDPTYSEYPHLLARLGAHVEAMPLAPDDGFQVDEDRLCAAVAKGHDWVVLVNPNNPVGLPLSRQQIARVVATAPPTTRFWIDETYVDFHDPAESFEREAARSRNVVVCKSMSKAYALSGARVAYLCGPPALVGPLRADLPPWSVGTVGQLAACTALRETAYYRSKWEQTARLRAALQTGLQGLGWTVYPSAGNFLLCRLPPAWPSSQHVIHAMAGQGVLLRGTAGMGKVLDDRYLRVAVRDEGANARLCEALQRFGSGLPAASGAMPALLQ